MRKAAKAMEQLRQIVSRAMGHSSKRTKWQVWKGLQVGLLVSGLALVGFYSAVRLDNYLSSRAALKHFEGFEASATVRDLPFADDPSSLGQEPTVRNDEPTRMPVAETGPRRGAALGVLEIPNVRLLAPLLDGTDAFTLNRGVGRIAETARPGEEGNMGIAGHRDSFFRKLKDIKEGDSIVLKTGKGVDTYVVDRLQIVAPSNVSVLRPEAMPSLTLVTCYPFYFIGNAPKRFVVTAYLTNHAAAGSTTSSPRPLTQPTNPTLEEQ